MASIEVGVASVVLEAHEALSGIFGSISLAAWIFLLVSGCENHPIQKDSHIVSYLNSGKTIAHRALREFRSHSY